MVYELQNQITTLTSQVSAVEVEHDGLKQELEDARLAQSEARADEAASQAEPNSGGLGPAEAEESIRTEQLDLRQDQLLRELDVARVEAQRSSE